MMWRGFTNKKLCWWCIRSCDEIRIIYQCMRNDSRVEDELYIKRVLMAVEDSVIFSLYSVSCMAKKVTTLKQFWLLSCFDSLDTNFECLCFYFRYYITVTNNTYTRPRPLHTGPGLARQVISWLGFWTGQEPNQPIFAVQTQTAGGLPGPSANTNGEYSGKKFHTDQRAVAVTYIHWRLPGLRSHVAVTPMRPCPFISFILWS